MQEGLAPPAPPFDSWAAPLFADAPTLNCDDRAAPCQTRCAPSNLFISLNDFKERVRRVSGSAPQHGQVRPCYFLKWAAPFMTDTALKKPGCRGPSPLPCGAKNLHNPPLPTFASTSPGIL